MIQFAQTTWLYVAASAALGLVLIFIYAQRSRQAMLQRFAAAQLLARLTRQVSLKQRRIKYALLILATVCICTALARPQVGFRWEAVKRKGIDIMIALDTSNSMLATDVKPNRLVRSKLGIIDFVRKLDGDRVGLIVFAGTAFPLCPLTMDYQAFDRSLAAVSADIIPKGGTDIPAAITAAERAFAADANHKLLVLITDGENLEGDALQSAKSAAQRGITIFTVGVGTVAGELIPQTDGQPSQFLRDAQGKVVQSRLDETTLRAIAQAAGGMYQPLGQQAQGLATIYQRKLALIPKQELDERMQQIPLERFQWLILPAVLLLCLEYLLNDRQRRDKAQPARSKKNKAFGLALVLFALSCSLGPWMTSATASSALDAYQRGDFEQAYRQYRQEAEQHPDDPRRHFNLGTAAYQTGQYAEALDAFAKSLPSEDLKLQNQTYYNMGNTLFYQGEQSLAKAPQETMTAWQRAIESYDHALRLDPQDQQAQANQAIVKKRLEQLQQQLPQNQSNQSDQNQKDDDSSDPSSSQSNSPQPSDKSQQDNQSAQAGDASQPDPASPPQQASSEKQPASDQQTSDTAQPAPAEHASPPPDDTGQTAASGQSAGADQEESADHNASASRTGEMTENEATALLDALKDSEMGMNALFVAPTEQQSGHMDRSLKNW